MKPCEHPVCGRCGENIEQRETALLAEIEKLKESENRWADSACRLEKEITELKEVNGELVKVLIELTKTLKKHWHDGICQRVKEALSRAKGA